MKKTAGSPSTVVLGIPFSTNTTEQTLDYIERMIEERSRNLVVTPNLDFVVRTMKDPVFKYTAYTASLASPDGMPLVWAGKHMRPPMKERVAGSDFVPLLMQRAAEKGFSVFLLGGMDGVAQLAAANCKKLWPKINIVGTYSPRFANIWEMDNDEMLACINSAGPDILLVCLGNPKQEFWTSMNYWKLNVPVSIGLGGTIDFLAGRIPRAPAWMKKLSAEWIFRLLLEPRRLARRYAIDLRDGVLPLFFQTVADNVLRIVDRIPRSNGQNGMHSSSQRVKSNGSEIGVLTIRNCHGNQLSLFMSCIDGFMENHDALIIDLTGLGQLHSELISTIVAIDRTLRSEARQMILVARKVQRLALRIAGVVDLLTVVSDEEKAMETIRNQGKKGLTILEGEGNGKVRIVSVRGELGIASLHLLDEIRPSLMQPGPVILDFGDLRFVDMGGLRHLIDLWIEARPHERMHCVTGIARWSSHLKSPGLQRYFVIHSTLEEALSRKEIGATKHHVPRDAENIQIELSR